ncbi:hypothetical protein [Chamaesiphon sp. OTE_75_metabat_556]|nr:hypothetical protein [Chamaesiphon sp. OTE_75_metabat_556]
MESIAMPSERLGIIQGDITKLTVEAILVRSTSSTVPTHYQQ